MMWTNAIKNINELFMLLVGPVKWNPSSIIWLKPVNWSEIKDNPKTIVITKNKLLSFLFSIKYFLEINNDKLLIIITNKLK